MHVSNILTKTSNTIQIQFEIHYENIYELAFKSSNIHWIWIRIHINLMKN